jgi:microcystin-dependent protein
MPETPLLGQLMAIATNFAPRGYAFCNGQILSIAQNTALFSLLGTTYGGNGTTTFALPNLQSRTPVHAGTSVNGSVYQLGAARGVETVTLDFTNTPSHSHTLSASTSSATTNSPSGSVPAVAHGGGRGGSFAVDLYTDVGTATSLAPTQMSPALGPLSPHNNIQPYLAINWCIALQGIFPARN